MNKKQKIIVSVTGIFLVLLIVFSITYAYYLSNIIGNTKEKSISLETADLEITYDNESAMISVAALESGTVAGTKTFTVTNNGNGPVDNYVVYLEKVVNTLTRPQDLVYTIDCKEYDTTAFETDPTTATSTSCNSISEETQFPTETDSLITSNIGIGKTQQYTLTITYLEPYEDQTADQGRIISGRINIVAREDEMDTNATLLNTIMKDTRITKNEGTPNFSVVETNEVGMYSAEDDYGTSWYFRGPQTYNYVSFAGLKWRVVRINGDGSIRIVSNSPVTTSYYNNPTNDNAYIGYMYGLTGVTTSQNRCLMLVDDVVTDMISNYGTQTLCEDAGGKWTTTAYEATHANVQNSTIKKAVDKFYENFLINYSEYIADTVFCNDKSSKTETAFSNTNYYEYNAYIRTNQNTPTLKCAENDQRDYSRLTMEEYTTIYDIKMNGDLKYPIALLTVDERIMAGLIYGAYTRPAGPYTADGWSMSPRAFDSNMAIITISGSSHPIWGNSSNNQLGPVSPVINLKNNVVVASGTGTVDDPYIIKTD